MLPLWGGRWKTKKGRGRKHNTDEIAKEVVKEITKEVVEEITKDVVKEVAKEVVEEITKLPHLPQNGTISVV